MESRGDNDFAVNEGGLVFPLWHNNSLSHHLHNPQTRAHTQVQSHACTDRQTRALVPPSCARLLPHFHWNRLTHTLTHTFTESVRLNTEVLLFWEERGDGWAGWRMALRRQPSLCPSAVINVPVCISQQMLFHPSKYSLSCDLWAWVIQIWLPLTVPIIFTMNRLFDQWAVTLIVKTSHHGFSSPKVSRRKAATPFYFLL